MKAKEPIIPLRLFRIRVIGFGNVAGFFMSAAMFGAFAYIPLFVQGVIGVSPSGVGYLLTPLMLSVVVSTTIGGRLMSKLSYRTILVPSMLLMAIGFICLSQMTSDTKQFQIIMYMIVTGLGIGAVYPVIGTAAQSAVDPSSRGVATSSSQFFRSIGGTIGVSVLGSLIAQRMSLGLGSLSEDIPALSPEQLRTIAEPQALLDSDFRDSLPNEVLDSLQSLFAHSLNGVFSLGLIFVCIALIACLFMGNARLVNQK